MRPGNLLLKLRALSPLRYTAIKCGHRTKQTGKSTVSGRTIITSMPKNKHGSFDYCLECIGEMAIQCAWCKDPILIGDPITLYTPRGEFQVPDHAVVHNEDPLQLVGCLGWDCAETGADRAGFWMPGDDGKGVVQRVPTVYEAILGAGGKSAVIVGDTHDMVEAMNPKLIPLEDEKSG